MITSNGCAELRGMDRASLAWASGLLALGVVAGAFGAHGLKPHITVDALVQWNTGVLYQFIHSLGMLGLAALGDRLPARTRVGVRWAFLVGILCFCGSLYLLSTREMTGAHGIGPWVGPITPLGGLLFILGWTWLFITAWRGSEPR